MSPTFVSFYTTRYEAEARELMLTLDRFGLRSDVRQMPDAGSWVKNCAMKAGFIRSMMNTYPGLPLVWLDADARVLASPSIFDTLTCDFAAHWRNGAELLSGTLFWSGTEAASDLCEDWMAECSRNPDAWDQVCLSNVVRSLPGLSITDLPACYTAIFDGAMCAPGSEVVLHTQASRRLKS